MTSFAQQRTVRHATTRRSRRVSIIWIGPIVTVVIGVGPPGIRCGTKEIVSARSKAPDCPPRACGRHRRDDPSGHAVAAEATVVVD